MHLDHPQKIVDFFSRLMIQQGECLKLHMLTSDPRGCGHLCTEADREENTVEQISSFSWDVLAPALEYPSKIAVSAGIVLFSSFNSKLLPMTAVLCCLALLQSVTKLENANQN